MATKPGIGLQGCEIRARSPPVSAAHAASTETGKTIDGYVVTMTARSHP